MVMGGGHGWFVDDVDDDDVDIGDHLDGILWRWHGMMMTGMADDDGRMGMAPAGWADQAIYSLPPSLPPSINQ